MCSSCAELAILEDIGHWPQEFGARCFPFSVFCRQGCRRCRVPSMSIAKASIGLSSLPLVMRIGRRPSVAGRLRCKLVVGASRLPPRVGELAHLKQYVLASRVLLCRCVPAVPHQRTAERAGPSPSSACGSNHGCEGQGHTASCSRAPGEEEVSSEARGQGNHSFGEVGIGGACQEGPSHPQAGTCVAGPRHEVHA